MQEGRQGPRFLYIEQKSRIEAHFFGPVTAISLAGGSIIISQDNLPDNPGRGFTGKLDNMGGDLHHVEILIFTT